MDKGKPGDELDEISTLVREEKKAALAAFRSRDFKSAVMRRWREGPEPAPERRPKVRLTMVTAAAAGLLVIATALFFLVRQPPEPEQELPFQALALALGELPGGVSLSREEPTGPGHAGHLDVSGLARTVRSGLAVVEAVKGEGETRSRLPERAGSVRRLSRYQRIEILYGDKVIERVLLSLKDPSKEV